MSMESQEFDAQISKENHLRRLERDERFGEPGDDDCFDDDDDDDEEDKQ